MVRAGIPERVAMELSGHKTRRVFYRRNTASTQALAVATGALQRTLGNQSSAREIVSLDDRDG
jgi:hypothetical protein